MSRRSRYPQVRVRSEGREAQRLLALVALGLTEAVRAGAVTTEHACAAFFTPTFLNLEHRGVEPNLLEALHAASELADVERLVPRALPRTLKRVRGLLLAAAENTAGVSFTRLVKLGRRRTKLRART
jgi:hypothetical protein